VQAQVKQRTAEYWCRHHNPLCGGSRNKGSNINIINTSTPFKMLFVTCHVATFDIPHIST
jgi:hypothetical protein